jgi:hypothetical protein
MRNSSGGYRDNCEVVDAVVRLEISDPEKMAEKLAELDAAGLRAIPGHGNILVFLPMVESDTDYKFKVTPEMTPFKGVRGQARETGSGPDRNNLERRVQIVCGEHGEKKQPVMLLGGTPKAFPGGDAAIHEAAILATVIMSRADTNVTICVYKFEKDLPYYTMKKQYIALNKNYESFIDEPIEEWPEDLKPFHDAILACRQRKNTDRPKEAFYYAPKQTRPTKDEAQAEVDSAELKKETVVALQQLAAQ